MTLFYNEAIFDNQRILINTEWDKGDKNEKGTRFSCNLSICLYSVRHSLCQKGMQGPEQLSVGSKVRDVH